MAEYEFSHPRIPQIGTIVLEGPDDLPPPTERDYWDAVRQQGVRHMALRQLKDEEKVSAYKNGYFDEPEPVEGQPEQPGIVDSLLDLGGKALLRGGQMAKAITSMPVIRESGIAPLMSEISSILPSGPYDKILKLEDKAIPYEKTENADQFREAGKYLFGFLDNTQSAYTNSSYYNSEGELGFDPVAEALKRVGMPFYSKNKGARGRVKTAAMDYAQESMVAGMGEGYARAASGGEFLYKGGKFLKDKIFLDEADDSDILDYVNSSIEFDALNHRYENSAELAAFVLENPQESVKAMGAGLVGGLTPIVEAEDLNEILIDEEDINLDSDFQQDIRSGFVQPDVGVSFLSEILGDPMNLAGGTTAKAVTAPQRVALSGKITQTLNEVTKLNQGKSMAIRALEKFPEDSLIAQRQAKYLEAANQSLAQKQKVLDKYARNSMFLRMAAQSSPDELLKVAAKNIDTASDAGKASMNMVYNAMKPSGKMGIVRKGVAMGAKLTPEIAGATIGASLGGPEGAALGAITPSLIKAAKIVSTMPENVAISYIMRSAAEAGEEITEQAARKQWRGITKYLYPTGILGIGIGSTGDGREEGGSNALLKFGAGALSLKALPKIAKLTDAIIRDSRIIGPELIYARGSEASPFFNRLALLPSGEEGLIGANADRFQALTRTSSGETILEKAIDKVRPIGRGIATSIKDEVPLSEGARNLINKIPVPSVTVSPKIGISTKPLFDVKGKTGAPFRPGLSDTNKMLSNPTRKVAQFLDRNPALGRSIETLGRLGAVATAGSTLPAAFGYVGSGGQAEGAIAGALVSAPFTSIGAGAGMFQAYKNKSDLFQQKMGDVYYYREHLNKGEQADFDKLPMEARMGLAGYSLSHPDILFKPLPADKMEGQGNWSFDENTGTSIVRFDKDTGAGLVEGVLAHEVGHHIEIHGLTPMVNKIFFGDQVTGEVGIYGKFNEEGEIVPNQSFEDKRTLYLNRLVKDASIKPENLDQYQGKEGNEIIAKEIFAETVRDYLLSGKKNKGNTAIEKMITSASDAMMGTSFVRDFLLKFNLPMKADGKFIEGGPFEGTLERNPALTKLIDQYYSDTRALRQREIQGEEITTPGSGRVDKKLSADGRRPIGGDDFESSFSLKDQNDPAIKAKLDTGGIFKWRPTADGKGSELETGATGTPKRYTAGELKKEQRIQGDHAIKVFEDNGIEIITNKDGKKSTGDITNLTSKMIDELAAGPWHPRQIQSLREISRSLREGDGERAGFLIGYFAKSSGRKPKAVPFTLRQEMPYGFKLTNDGNILVLLHDVPQLEKNLKFLKSGRRLPGKYKDEYNQLFGNDTEVWKAFQQYRINTANGMDGQLGLDDKPAKAMRKKNFLNALHGAIDKEHIKLNPILLEISNLKGMDMFNPKKTSPFGPATKTFRLDGIFDVTRSGNRNSNVNLDRVRTLLMPRQSKNFDKKVALRTNESLIDLVDKIAKEEGVSRNDVLNRILQEKLDPETQIELPENVPADPSPIAEEIPPMNVTPKVESRTPSIPWSKGSDPSLNWLRNSPDKKLFMPAQTVEQKKANKYGQKFKQATESDKIILSQARREWMEEGYSSQNFQDWMHSGFEEPALAVKKNDQFIPIKLYYGGLLGVSKRPGFNAAAPLEAFAKSEFAEGVTKKAESQYSSDDIIFLTTDKKRAKTEQEKTVPGVKPLEFASNASYIFDPLNSEHISMLSDSIRAIEPDSPELLNIDQLFQAGEDILAYQDLLKRAGWQGVRVMSEKGDGVAIFGTKNLKLISDQSGEGKFLTKDRAYGKVSGLFGKELPSSRMSAMGQRERGRDVRFMPQMELNFGDGKTNPISADNLSKDISKPISFWDIFNIDKNGKKVYPQVAESLINTGDEYMDWQTAADYAPRLNLDVKRLRQEMRLAQKRNNSSGKYFLPKLPNYKKDGKTFKIPLPPTSPEAPRAYHGSKKKYDYPDEKYLGSFTKNLGYIGMGYYGHPKRFDAEMYAVSESKSVYSFEMLPEGQTLNSHLRVNEQHPSIQKNLEKIFETKVSGTGLKLKDLWAKFYTENPTRYVDEMLRSDPDIFGGQIDPDINKNIGNQIYMGLVNLYSKSPVEKVGYLATSPDNIAAASTINKMLAKNSIKGAISFPQEGPWGRQVSPEVVIFDFNEIRDFRSEGNKLFMPASEAGAGKGKQAEAAKLWQEKGTDSPYFKKWFGKSKVVDENGDPLVVYHGTGASFNTFNDGFSIGPHFGNIDQANDIVSTQTNANIKPVYLSIKNPLRLRDAGNDNANSFIMQLTDILSRKEVDRLDKLAPNSEAIEIKHGSGKKFDEVYRKTNKEALLETKKLLISKGYDGIVYKNEHEAKGSNLNPDSYIAFQPEQIKSSTGNRGTFDAGERNINYMPSDPKAPTRQPANRIQQQAPAMPGNRFMAPAASAGAKLSERFR